MNSEVKAGQVWTRCDGDTGFKVRKREVLSVEDGIAVVRTMGSARATQVRIKNERLPGHKLLSAPTEHNLLSPTAPQGERECPAVCPVCGRDGTARVYSVCPTCHGTGKANTEPGQEPPTPGAIPPEAIDEAAEALSYVHDQDVPWETYAKAALEAAAPAIRAQDQARIQELERQRSAALAAVLIERERMIERVTAKRRDEEIVYTPFLQGHDQGITDAIRAIRSAADDE